MSTPKTCIGARWTPAHVVRLDSASGFYEEINAARLSSDAIALQSALLLPPRSRGRIRGALLASVIGASFALVAFFGLAS